MMEIMISKIDEKRIVELVSNGLKEILKTNSNEVQEEINLDTVIFGQNGLLDSLSLVTFIVDLENAVSVESGKDIILAGEKAMSQKNSPFMTVKTLSEFIKMLLDEL